MTLWLIRALSNDDTLLLYEILCSLNNSISSVPKVIGIVVPIISQSGSWTLEQADELDRVWKSPHITYDFNSLANSRQDFGISCDMMYEKAIYI